jgi:hypothetical protein
MDMRFLYEVCLARRFFFEVGPFTLRQAQGERFINRSWWACLRGPVEG